ncbi:MAG TPA: FecR domain-containing protein [Anaerohalosphaeraceae bacterium]|nr:FecR domain-containing protein [Anaerohalosphaeraceae bacterium]
MKNARHIQRMFELLDAVREGTIRPEEVEELDRILAEDKKACRFYYEYFNMCALLRSGKAFEPNLSVLPQAGDSLHNMAFWKALAREEETAPEIERPAERKEHQEIPPSVKSAGIPAKVSRLSMASLAVSAAALIFVIGYAFLVSVGRGVEVATLTDSMNAKWADRAPLLERGTRLTTGNNPQLLREGYAELLFDNQARVTLEGPAEFRILAEDRLALTYGRVYVKIPKSATGFSVLTPHAKIIDLGTEFGVISNPSGETEVHVFRGQTILVGSGPKEKKSILNLTAGSAGAVCDNGATIKEIRYAPYAFTQKIDSRTGLLWKGQRSIQLTHLLAGHIFTAAPEGIEIDPASGEYVIHENYVSGTERRGQLEYRTMSSPFIDGSFIPQGGVQNISRSGLSYSFPQTSGCLHFNLSDQKTVYDTKTDAYYPLFLEPSSAEKPSLFMHPNMGFTLDLNKIRRQIPSLQIQRFTAECGIALSAREALKKIYPDGNIPEDERPSVDFAVLLDGKAKQTFTGITLESGILKIDVDIQPTERFLTLAATDENRSIKYDWFVLIQPELQITDSDSEESHHLNSPNP